VKTYYAGQPRTQAPGRNEVPKKTNPQFAEPAGIRNDFYINQYQKCQVLETAYITTIFPENLGAFPARTPETGLSGVPLRSILCAGAKNAQDPPGPERPSNPLRVLDPRGLPVSPENPL
jgi:hypothetical protein